MQRGQPRVPGSPGRCRGDKGKARLCGCRSRARAQPDRAARCRAPVAGNADVDPALRGEKLSGAGRCASASRSRTMSCRRRGMDQIPAGVRPIGGSADGSAAAHRPLIRAAHTRARIGSPTAKPPGRSRRTAGWNLNHVAAARAAVDAALDDAETLLPRPSAHPIGQKRRRNREQRCAQRVVRSIAAVPSAGGDKPGGQWSKRHRDVAAEHRLDAPSTPPASGCAASRPGASRAHYPVFIDAHKAPTDCGGRCHHPSPAAACAPPPAPRLKT